jgi:3-methylfumaryl-CoA hydratase
MTQAPLDIDHLRQWIGRTEEAEDTVSPRLVAGYLAVLDDPNPQREVGALAPLAIHWCLAPETRPMSQLGLDGHPKRGGLLPPVPLPHRMWAGGKIDLAGRFTVGDVITRHSTVQDVTVKTGRSGTLCFVAVDHAFHGPQGLILTERHDIVYRAARDPNAPPRAAVSLFRPHLQRPPHPLRPQPCDHLRRLLWPRRSRPAASHDDAGIRGKTA